MNTERDNWRDITSVDATDDELRLVHKISGPKPDHITPEQWRLNMRAVAQDIRQHVEAKTNPHAFGFTIGDRTYHLARDSRRGNGWCIISKGDLVEYVSSAHYGDVDAFNRIAKRLGEIETAWAAVQIAQGKL